MLSSRAERKNVMKAMSHNSLVLLRVLIRLVMMAKPPWTSISSTIVMAPIRKNSVSEISPNCSIICTLTIKLTHCSIAVTDCIVGLVSR